MINPEFQDDDFETIQAERIHNADYRVRQRMQILYLKCIGYSHQTIAEIADVHSNTVTQVLRIYDKDGLLSVISFNYEERMPLAAHEEQIEELFEKDPPATLKEASGVIKKKAAFNSGLIQSHDS